jgi:DNA/RNA-binding domain of Phe-tRNA-synthetase-like protein
MIFSVDDRLFDIFPGLKIGVLVCRVDNTKYGEDVLEPVLRKTRADFDYEKPQEHPRIKAWRQAFGKLGMPASKYQSSIEALIRRVLKGGAFPRINPVVDLYNAASIEFLVPIGGHDLTTIEGDIFLGFAEGGEPFTPIEGGEQEYAERGEVVYRDKNAVLTRRWVWRQSSKDKVTTETRFIFIPIDVMGGVSPSLPENAMTRIDAYLKNSRVGEIALSAVLTVDRPAIEFDVT